MTTDHRGTAAVAGAVRAEMARRGLRQADVAQLLGVSQGAVSRKVQGDVAFTVDELFTLADRWGLTPADLMPPEPPPFQPRRRTRGRVSFTREYTRRAHTVFA